MIPEIRKKNMTTPKMRNVISIGCDLDNGRTDLIISILSTA